MGNGLPPTGIIWTRDGTFWYRSTCSDVMWSMVTLDGGGVRSTVSLYHPYIWIHDSLMRGVSEARMDSTTDLALAAMRRRYSWSIALIFWLSVRTRPWLLSWIQRSEIPVSTICQVSGCPSIINSVSKYMEEIFSLALLLIPHSPIKKWYQILCMNLLPGKSIL